MTEGSSALTDTVAAERRSANMALTRGKDTRPELFGAATRCSRLPLPSSRRASTHDRDVSRTWQDRLLWPDAGPFKV
jgi:hypothetical protein